jgi:hypothetical protein
VELESLEIRLQFLGIEVKTLMPGPKSLGIRYILGGKSRKREVFYGRLAYEFTRLSASHGKNMEHGICNKRAGAGRPPEHITQLVNEAQAADIILDKVKSGERTAADVVQRNMIFKDMETEARFTKKH